MLLPISISKWCCVLLPHAIADLEEIKVWHFFAFPKTSKLRKALVDKCRRKNYKPSEYAKICEHHFVDSDFVMSRAFAASVGFTQKFLLRLKPDAITTVIPESKLTSTPLRKKKKNYQESPKLLKNVED